MARFCGFWLCVLGAWVFLVGVFGWGEVVVWLFIGGV